jgi:hypothetical protein
LTGSGRTEGVRDETTKVNPHNMTDTLDFWPRLVLASLATWRLAHLLAREDGPFDLIARLRWWMGQGLWVAAPLAWWVGGSLWEGVVVWLALSGAACLCERFTERDDPTPVLMQPLPEAHHEKTPGRSQVFSSPRATKGPFHAPGGLAQSDRSGGNQPTGELHELLQPTP